jgi:hypothetical protein
LPERDCLNVIDAHTMPENASRIEMLVSAALRVALDSSIRNAA